MARAFDPGQPAVVIDAETGERQLIWAELDSQASADADRNLFIRPGKNFREGRRYIVALRNLKRADGSAIEPQRRVPRLPRRHRHDVTGRRGAARAHGGRCSPRSGAPASRAATSTWRGTSPSAAGSGSPGGCWGCATTALAELGDAAPQRPGRVPAATARTRRDAEITPRVRHASRCRASSTSRLPAGLALRVRRREEQRPGAARTATRWLANYDCIMPHATPPAARRGWRSTATGCSATPPRSTSRRSARWSSASTSPTARPTGRGCRRRTSRTSALILNDLSRFPTLTDRMQQGILTSSTSAG